jgi:hypothetical protein
MASRINTSPNLAIHRADLAKKGLRSGKHSSYRMNMKRMRGRSHRNNNGGGGGGGGAPRQYNGGNVPLNRNHVFDSSGPDLRIRGTAQQLFEKYLQLGRDASSSGDRVMAESYFQYAEHYFRIVNAINQASQQQGPSQNQSGQNAGGQHQGGQPHNGQRRHERESFEGGDGQQGNFEEQPAIEAREIPITVVVPES